MKRSIRDQPVLVPFKTVSDNFWRDHPAKMSSHSFLSSCEQFDVLLQNWYSFFTIKICSWTFFSQLFREHFFQELMRRGMRQVMDRARESQEMFEQNLPEMIHSKACQEAQRRSREIYDTLRSILLLLMVKKSGSPVEYVKIPPVFTVFYISKVGQDFFHQE